MKGKKLQQKITDQNLAPGLLQQGLSACVHELPSQQSSTTWCSEWNNLYSRISLHFIKDDIESIFVSKKLDADAPTNVKCL